MPRLANIFLVASSLGAQVTIVDTGSTNFPGMNIVVAPTAHRAIVEERGGARRELKLTKQICGKLMADLKSAGPLADLPKPHCMKSVSFGSSLFVEFKGARSPDLSCPQTDPRSAALKRDVADIMQLAKAN